MQGEERHICPHPSAQLCFSSAWEGRQVLPHDCACLPASPDAAAMQHTLRFTQPRRKTSESLKKNIITISLF